jgi:hypothetical protein
MPDAPTIESLQAANTALGQNLANLQGTNANLSRNFAAAKAELAALKAKQTAKPDAYAYYRAHRPASKRRRK